MTIYDLTPTDNRKSFYGKAKVYADGNILTLYSYNTPVARLDGITKKVTRLWDGWSATTGRHIKSFCNMGKAEFMALPYDGE